MPFSKVNDLRYRGPAARKVKEFEMKHNLKLSRKYREELAAALRLFSVSQRKVYKLPDSPGTSKAARTAFKSALKHVTKIIEYLNQEESDVESIETRKKWLLKALNKNQYLAITLTFHGCNWSEVITALATNTLPSVKLLEKLESTINEILQNFDGDKGRPADDSLNRFILSLEQVYVAGTGLRATLSTNWLNDNKPEGNFFEFVKESAHACGYKKSDIALAQSLKRAKKNN